MHRGIIGRGLQLLLPSGRIGRSALAAAARFRVGGAEGCAAKGLNREPLGGFFTDIYKGELGVVG